MDCATIETPNLYLREGIMEGHFPLLREMMRSAGRYQITENHEGSERWASIKLGPEHAAIVNVRKIDTSWLVKQIRLFLPHWLYGHNGIPIPGHENFLLALHRYQQVVGMLFEEKDRHRVLPGIGRGNDSYWSSVEFSVHLSDPSGRLLQAMKNISHPRIYSGPTTSDTSIKLSGTGLTIRAYDKEIQMRSKSSNADSVLPPPISIVRLECQWKSELLANYLSQAAPNRFPNRDSNSEEEPEYALRAGFSLETLRKAFELVIRETTGVFVPAHPAKKIGAIPQLLAELALTLQIPLSGVVNAYRSIGARSRRTTREHCEEAAECYSMRNAQLLGDYLQASSSQPEINSLSIDAKMAQLKLPNTPIPSALRQAYHDENSTASSHWQPVTDQPLNWPNDAGLTERDVFKRNPNQPASTPRPKSETGTPGSAS